jgi:transposase InsO family protein
VDRSGLRGQLLKAQAEAGDIVLLFGDESEALTHPYLAHVWAKKGADLRVPAPGQASKVALIGAFDWAQRELIVHTSPHKRSADFIAFLEQIDRRYGPKPGVDAKPVWLVLDNGPIHTSKATRPFDRLRSAGRPRVLAHGRVAAELCPRAQCHRAGLA